MIQRHYHRIFLIVADSFGIGAMPDAAEYGDAGADTYGHILARVPEMQLPNLWSLGLDALHQDGRTSGHLQTTGWAARLRELSRGKDTMTGHWEMMGIRTVSPFITFTDTGFPPELIAELEQATGRKIIGNRAESGTVILDELGEREISENCLIVYTSADSVLQICGNEEIMGLETLYRYCEIARQLTMKPEWRVGRVIARPYVGRHPGAFVRTANRRDYALKPTGRTVLNALQEVGYAVISVGKISDIFAGEGITAAYHSESSVHGMEQTIDLADKDFEGLCFVNLVDFDAKWGHRRNPQGYAEELMRFDEKLGVLMGKLRPDDLLLITADHGNDPTWTGTDHTREKVPFLAWSPSMERCGVLPEQESFAVIGATLAENFGLTLPEGCIGISLLGQLGSCSDRGVTVDCGHLPNFPL